MKNSVFLDNLEVLIKRYFLVKYITKKKEGKKETAKASSHGKANA